MIFSLNFPFGLIAFHKRYIIYSFSNNWSFLICNKSASELSILLLQEKIDLETIIIINISVKISKYILLVIELNA